MTRAILPCAGLGTRMNMKHNESKELLIDPSTGKPLIEYHLDICKEYDLNPLIITRPEKIDLINYCYDRFIDIQIVTPQGEWMDTVKHSHPHWEDTNILLLPDTKFESHDVIKELKTSLELGVPKALALHYVEDGSKWGCVDDNMIYEKPIKLTNKHSWAWGLIAFKEYVGDEIFSDLSRFKSHCMEKVSYSYLKSFKDVTRTGKIE